MLVQHATSLDPYRMSRAWTTIFVNYEPITTKDVIPMITAARCQGHPVCVKHDA